MWLTPHGKFISVPLLPNGEGYPHYLLGEVAQQVEAVEKDEPPLQSG